MLKTIKGVNPYYYNPENIYRIQKWKYDPRLFSIAGKLDPVSLICSLKDINDERIHKCLGQVKEEIDTWQKIID